MAMEPDAGLSRRLRTTLFRFLLLYIPVALVLALTTYLFYLLEANNERRLLKSEQHHQVQLEKEAVAGILEDMVVDARGQAQHELFENLQGPPGPRLLKDLAHELTKVLETTNSYLRILYIDRNGRVLLHLAREGGQARVERKDIPSDLAGQPWVSPSLKLPPGKVYIFPVLKNDDKGAVVRVAAPVTNRWGEPEGLLVMDYRASQAMRKMAGLYFSQGMVLLLDQQGHILLGGRYQGAPQIKPQEDSGSFAKIWPRMWDQVARQDQGQVFAKDGLFTWDTVTPPQPAQDGHSQLKIVALVPEALVDAAVGIYLIQLTQLLTIVLFVAGLICWFLAWSQVRHRLAQQALAQSEQRLQDIMTFSPAVIYLKDHAGRYQFINRRFEQLMGIKQEQALGMTDREMFPAQTAKALHRHDKQALVGKGPLHSEEQIRQKDGMHSYLTAKFPLRDPDGRIYGVCGISTDITELKNTQAELKRAMEAAETANQSLMEKQERLDEDLQAAAGIQRTLLPYNLPHMPQVELAWKFAPSEFIGGDLFHAQPLGPGQLCLYMLDISGHGVPASLMTVSVHETLDPASGHVAKRDLNGALQALPPGKVLSDLDREYPLERFGKSFSIVYLLLRLTDGELVYSSAGHPHPILFRAGGELEELTAGGTLIGLDGAVPFDEGRTVMRVGDRLILYTDGVVEYRNPQGHMFGVERLHRHVIQGASLPVGELIEVLWRELMSFGHNRPVDDDVSIMGLEYKGAGLGL
ncbi:MAG: SpoIIE family protein phosphatase [Desulfarculaceae bacterium]|nr:SpoIIE family protein phosphatase [Desulfarculaceae bacterium]MCF8048868.1 SpoIIE family protein phosphatase [Desulfarculaceae bacterium]MCF8098721.1 SpoIIE family protein phosphatase [Desulfarculaceae bacterium]MCF8121001.1 SpoIIE family protein phosphatase [Desulfarculaceae bacterium]